MAHRTSTSNTPLPLDYHTDGAQAFHLLSLPLFQGLSQLDLLRIAETTPLSFAQHPQGECIAKESEACRQLTVLFKGSVEVMSEADDHGYSLTETLKAPLVIEPEHLFGLHQHYRRTYTTAEACNTLSISKQHVITLTKDFMVFRLNLLNIICTQSQRLQRQPWHPQPTDLRQRIIHFFKGFQNQDGETCHRTQRKSLRYIHCFERHANRRSDKTYQRVHHGAGTGATHLTDKNIN